ncbi:MAG TPA: hypothetical protein VGK19_00315 [Capsulimonadaceae bacterium]
MTRYKTVLVDYEGLQASLDLHSEQGWKLVSLTPDTWRKVLNSQSAADKVEVLGSTADGTPAEEFCASYYLLVFSSEDDPRFEIGLAAASETLPDKDYTLPDY